jgi:hypothetical protein
VRLQRRVGGLSGSTKLSCECKEGVNAPHSFVASVLAPVGLSDALEQHSLWQAFSVYDVQPARYSPQPALGRDFFSVTCDVSQNKRDG